MRNYQAAPARSPSPGRPGQHKDGLKRAGNGSIHHIYVNAAISVEAGQHVGHWFILKGCLGFLGQAVFALVMLWMLF